jgi:SAM-dependent methyltransferase
MSKQFDKAKSFERYAEYYDLLYQDKDYAKECDFIESIFHKFSSKPVKTVLDGGCGTGGHAFLLAERGYQVTGIDGSASMIKKARKKLRGNLKLDFQTVDLRKLELGKKFDACACMFAVMNYITQTDDILKTLKNIRRHLEKDSLFVFDIWNGLAVLRVLPSERVKIVENKEKRIIRIARPELDAFNHLCRVHYHLIINEGSTLVDELEETHVIRYFFPQEIKHYLQDSDFEVVKICPFLDLEGKVDENTWNIALITKAI